MDKRRKQREQKSASLSACRQQKKYVMQKVYRSISFIQISSLFLLEISCLPETESKVLSQKENPPHGTSLMLTKKTVHGKVDGRISALMWLHG